MLVLYATVWLHYLAIQLYVSVVCDGECTLLFSQAAEWLNNVYFPSHRTLILYHIHGAKWLDVREPSLHVRI